MVPELLTLPGNMSVPPVLNGVRVAQLLGLWELMPLATTFQLYRGGQFYWWTHVRKYIDKIL